MTLVSSLLPLLAKEIHRIMLSVSTDSYIAITQRIFCVISTTLSLVLPIFMRFLSFSASLRFPFSSSHRNVYHLNNEGLGDTNYDTFQGFPRLLDEMLASLGAKTFYPRGEADDATG